MIIGLIKLAVSIIATVLYIKLIIRFVSRKNQNLLIIPISFFYFFFILPVLLDLIIGRPVPLFKYYGFITSGKDFLTEVIYNFAILFSMIVYYRSFNKNRQTLSLDLAFKYKDIVFIAIYVIDIVIIFLTLLQVDGTTMQDILSYNTRYLLKTGMLQMISTFSFVAVLLNICPLFLEKNKKTFWFKLLLLVPIFVFMCLCNGKKSIIFELFFSLLAVIYANKIVKKPSRFFFLTGVAMLSLLLFYNAYLNNVVTTKKFESFQDSYNSYRVEFGRDDTLKTVIYDELYNDEKILKYRGESLLFYPTFFIKRDNWKDKPYPYATYFTARLLNLSSVRYVGWHMTTSIYDEMVSNVGLFALIFLPFLVCFLVKKLNMITNKNNIVDLIIKFLGTLLIGMYFAVQINALVAANLLFIALFMLKLFRDKFKIRFK